MKVSRKITSGLAAVLAVGAMAKQVGEMAVGERMLAPTAFYAYCLRTDDCLSVGDDKTPTVSEAAQALPTQSILLRASTAVLAQATADPWQDAFARARAERDVATAGITLSPSRWSLGGAFGAARSLQTAPVEQGASSAPSEVRVTLDKKTRDELRKVNKRVNGMIRPESDMTLFHQIDVWGAKVGSDGRLYGDCEDYVLIKRRQLIETGLPAEALSIAVARNTRGELHAVLIVATDRGDYVMDNLSYWVRPWSEVPYKWIMRQVNGSAGDWRAVVATRKS
jgi:predicted transglutaminase-like cysteine proteinase